MSERIIFYKLEHTQDSGLDCYLCCVTACCPVRWWREDRWGTDHTPVGQYRCRIESVVESVVDDG